MNTNTFMGYNEIVTSSSSFFLGKLNKLRKYCSTIISPNPLMNTWLSFLVRFQCFITMYVNPAKYKCPSHTKRDRERERERERESTIFVFLMKKKKRKKKEHILYNKKDEMSNDHINLKSHRVSIYPINEPNPITPLFD